MKIFKLTFYTTITFILVSLFAVSPVIGHGMSSDFYSGQKAGIEQVGKDNKFGTCMIGFNSLDNELEKARGYHVAKLMSDDRSDDYIKGFKAGYERTWQTRLDINCNN